jgi:hypothetical protein
VADSAARRRRDFRVGRHDIPAGRRLGRAGAQHPGAGERDRRLRQRQSAARTRHPQQSATTLQSGQHLASGLRQPWPGNRCERRFRAFLGLSTLAPEIVNGIERLGLDPRLAATWDPAAANARSFRLAEQRDELAAMWRAAITPPGGGPGRVALDVLLPAPRLHSLAIFRHWLERDTGLLARLRRWWLQRHTRQAATALLRALQAAGMVAAPLCPEHIHISVSTRELRVRVDAADARVERLIAESLREIYDPLFPARYLLHRGDRVWRVPQVLGTRKALAVLYQRHWRRAVGRATLTYVHTDLGKTLTLYARQRFLATAHAERPRVSLRWT